MKYAITSTGYTLEDHLDRRFGRCEYIVFYDTESKSLEFLPNPYKENEEGVAPLLVELINSKGINKIVSGSFGIKIKELLDSKKIQMIIPGDQDIAVGRIIEIISNKG